MPAHTANSSAHMPRNVARRILARCKANEPVVVTSRRGIPSRVYGLEEYKKMQEHPKLHKPWERRHAAHGEQIPDPLGAVEGNVIGRLTRARMHEEGR